MMKFLVKLGCKTGVSSFPLNLHAFELQLRLYNCKNENFQWRTLNSFLFFAQNINCGYTLKPPY